MKQCQIFLSSFVLFLFVGANKCHFEPVIDYRLIDLKLIQENGSYASNITGRICSTGNIFLAQELEADQKNPDCYILDTLTNEVGVVEDLRFAKGNSDVPENVRDLLDIYYLDEQGSIYCYNSSNFNNNSNPITGTLTLRRIGNANETTCFEHFNPQLQPPYDCAGCDPLTTYFIDLFITDSNQEPIEGVHGSVCWQHTESIQFANGHELTPDPERENCYLVNGSSDEIGKIYGILFKEIVNESWFSTQLLDFTFVDSNGGLYCASSAGVRTNGFVATGDVWLRYKGEEEISRCYHHGSGMWGGEPVDFELIDLKLIEGPSIPVTNMNGRLCSLYGGSFLTQGMIDPNDPKCYTMSEATNDDGEIENLRFTLTSPRLVIYFIDENENLYCYSGHSQNSNAWPRTGELRLRKVGPVSESSCNPILGF